VEEGATRRDDGVFEPGSVGGGLNIAIVALSRFFGDVRVVHS
jgi:hypothetical protein